MDQLVQVNSNPDTLSNNSSTHSNSNSTWDDTKYEEREKYLLWRRKDV